MKYDPKLGIQGNIEALYASSQKTNFNVQANKNEAEQNLKESLGGILDVASLTSDTVDASAELGQLVSELYGAVAELGAIVSELLIKVGGN